MKTLTIVCLFCIASISSVLSCQDKWSSNDCAMVKRFCIFRDIQRKCAKTCNKCPGTTSAPVPGTTSAPVSPVAGSCGQRQIASGKVIAGTDAKRGSWPWQILLLINKRPGCGGSIISKRYVVTAAHCIGSKRASGYRVVVGEHDRTKREGSEKTLKVAKVIVHKSYSPYTLNNDIAILKLSSDITFNQYVQPVCLPSKEIPVGHPSCYITGWGKIQHPGNMHTYLQQALMPPVDSLTCYNKNKNVLRVPITDAMVCAGEGGKTAISGCHGDSGGPYVCNVDGQWELHGSVSWGSPECKSTAAYTVFARTSYFKKWISDTMKANGN